MRSRSKTQIDRSRDSKLAIALALSLSACSHASSGVATDGGGSIDAAAPRAAQVHRPTETACDPTPLPAEPKIPDGGVSSYDECTKNADCVAHANGRCLVSASFGRASCFYDQCLGDRDCAPGQACSCAPATGPVNACVIARCYVDADCGRGGSCSPSIQCGGLVGFYCHSSADECIDDMDCSGGVPCSYDIDAAHWACVQKTCSGR